MIANRISFAFGLQGPSMTVDSGRSSSLVAVHLGCESLRTGKGRRVHRLAVSHAFHSVLMEPMLQQFSQLLAEISAAQPRIGLVSNLTGQLAGQGYGSAQYWVQHVRHPVRFAQGVQIVEALEAGVFVEVGPGGGLTAAVEESLLKQPSPQPWWWRWPRTAPRSILW
jgi:acyl transferase domain-containing protein